MNYQQPYYNQQPYVPQPYVNVATPLATPIIINPLPIGNAFYGPRSFYGDRRYDYGNYGNRGFDHR
jgi:hypothetical protein